MQLPKEDAGLAERDFTVIIPAPTSFPSSLLAQAESGTPSGESRVTRITPTPILSTQNPLPSPSHPPAPAPPPAAPAPPPPPAPTPPTQPTSTSAQRTNPIPSTSTTGASTTTSSTSTSGRLDDGGGDEDGNDQATSTTTRLGNTAPDQEQGQGGSWMMNSGEKSCVCDNKSFNVPQVAALCSSCIAIANELQNDMDVIMNACKFAPQSYSPDKDKVVNNVRVQATPPKTVWGQNAGVEIDNKNSATALKPIRLPLITVAAGLSLLQQWLLY